MKKNGSISERKSERIPSLDFWRGFFLLMIYLNHLPQNPFSFFSPRNWGFADSAEPFIFISGFSAMLAFAPYFEHGGMGIGLLRTIKRLWQLFCAHVLLVFAMSALIAFASDFIDSKPIMEQLNFSPFFIETDIAIVKLLKLGYMPNMTDILPLYIVLVVLFPFFWFLVKKSSFIALAVSFALWLWVNITGFSFSNYPEGAIWFFNPLAWQLLFVCGMIACKEQKKFKNILKSKTLFLLSLSIVIASIIIISPWTQIESLSSFRLLSPEILSIDEKTNLSWVRIVHFLALAFIAAKFFPVNSPFWQKRIVKIISVCGRHSLAVYCVGSLFSLTITLLLQAKAYSTFESLILVSSGGIFLVLLASALEKARLLLENVKKLNRSSDKENVKMKPLVLYETNVP